MSEEPSRQQSDTNQTDRTGWSGLLVAWGMVVGAVAGGICGLILGDVGGLGLGLAVGAGLGVVSGATAGAAIRTMGSGKGDPYGTE